MMLMLLMALFVGAAIGFLIGEHTAGNLLLPELEKTEQQLHDLRNELLAATLKLRKLA